MIKNLINLILTVFISIIVISCNGQVKSKSEQNQTTVIGTIVSGLDNQIWVIFQDSKGNYWFGSNGNGVYKYDGTKIIQFTTKDGLAYDQIRGIQEDKEGNLYIETQNGISKYNGTEFKTLQPIKSSKNEWKLEPNDLWFGYNANDLYRLDGDSLYELELPRKDLKKAFGIETEGVPFEGNNNSPYAVFGVNKDKNGNIWFGTATAGAFRYDGDSFLWFGEKELSTLPDGRVPGVRSMIQDKNGYYWLSNIYSKYKINSDLPKGYEKIEAVELPEKIIKDKILYFMSGIADKQGKLWMTTYDDGIWCYNGESLSNIEIHNGTEDVLLISIYLDDKGGIWLGTNNDGVYKQNGEKFEKFEL